MPACRCTRSNPQAGYGHQVLQAYTVTYNTGALAILSAVEEPPSRMLTGIVRDAESFHALSAILLQVKPQALHSPSLPAVCSPSRL